MAYDRTYHFLLSVCYICGWGETKASLALGNLFFLAAAPFALLAYCKTAVPFWLLRLRVFDAPNPHQSNDYWLAVFVSRSQGHSGAGRRSTCSSVQHKGRETMGQELKSS